MRANPFHSKLTLLLIATIFNSAFTYAQMAQPQPAAYNQKLQSSALLFMENRGQVADDKSNLRPDILFTANSAGAKLYLSADAIHYQFTKTEYPKGYEPHKREPAKDLLKEAELQKQIKTSTHRFSLELQGANLHPTVITEKQSAYTENYYLAQCPNGITGVHGYEKITYKNVYPNIDWVIYSRGGFMEYDFLVHPGGNPSNIKLKVKDAESVAINTDGELVMKTSLGEVREKAPVSYADGTIVESHFKLLGDGTIGFDVEPQPGKELRIDPSIIWSTYYGGNGYDYGLSCVADSAGNVYLGGYTSSATPNSIASGGYQNTYGGIVDAYLVKFNANGDRLWATYYGGAEVEVGYSVSVNNSGTAVYLCGFTQSSTGIASAGHQNVFGGYEDAFLVKFGNNGNRIWATYYGGIGKEDGRSCTVDKNDNVYISGSTESAAGIASGGFLNTYNGVQKAYLVKFDSTGSRTWGTYYGGAATEYGYSCCVDTGNNIYLSGIAYSATGISMNGFQNSLSSYGIPYLVKFDSTGSRIWGTYYGSTIQDFGPHGNVFCCTDYYGNVFISCDFGGDSSILSANFQNTYGGAGDAFLAKFNSNGTRLWARSFGGNRFERGFGCTADTVGNVYLIGFANSLNAIGFSGFQNNFSGGENEAFIAKFDNDGYRIWSSYKGGNSYDFGYGCAIGRNNVVYLAGVTSSNTNMGSSGFQNDYGGNIDAYLTKIKGNGPGPDIITLCPNGSYSLTSNVTGPDYRWQLDSGSGYVNLLNDNTFYTGTNSKTLQLHNIPSNFYGYLYRCMVNFGFGEVSYSDVYQVNIGNRWLGNTNSTWENPANWSCGSLPDGNTDVIINSGPVILNSNGICRTLTVRPGVSFTITTGNTLTITH